MLRAQAESREVRRQAAWGMSNSPAARAEVPTLPAAEPAAERQDLMVPVQEEATPVVPLLAAEAEAAEQMAAVQVRTAMDPSAALEAPIGSVLVVARSEVQA